MKNRIMAVLLILVLIIQSNLVFAVGNEKTETYAPYVTSEKFLKALNITSGGADYTSTVTRGDAASYIAVMLGEANSYTDFRGIFSDVDTENSNALAIEKLADLGIIRGDGNYAFRPDDNLTYNEAAIILMNALGYALIGNANVSEAKRAGVLDNIKAEFDVVNLGDLFVMMRNTLMASPVAQTVYGTNGYYEKSEQTLLYKIYSIVYADGVMVKNDLTYLWSAQNEPDNTIEVKTTLGSIKMKTTSPDVIREDLGKGIRAYYYFNKETGVNVYVHHEINASNKIIEILPEQLEPAKSNFSTRKIAYYEIGANSETVVSLENNYNIIYNDVAYKSNTINLSDISKKIGKIELVDSDYNGAYETLKIKVYDSVIVESASLSAKFITDKFDKTIKLDIDDDNYEKIFIYDAEGKEAGFEQIVPGCVISYAKSDGYNGFRTLEIRISNDITNGKITKYKKGEFVPYIIIDGSRQSDLYERAAYDSAGKLINYISNSNIIAYADVFGNIIYIDDDKSRDLSFGILVGVGKNDGSFVTKVDLRLITTIGEVIETTLDEKALIDGTPYSGKLKEAYDYLSAQTTTVSFTDGPSVTDKFLPIRYKLSEENSVKIIDTVNPGTGSNDGLTKVGGGTYTGNGGNVLGFTIPYNADATLIQIKNKDLTSLKAFSDVNNISSKIVGTTFKGGESYHVLAYSSDDESIYAEFIIAFDKSKVYREDPFFVVEDITQGYNADKDEIMNQLCGYRSGTYTELWIDKGENLSGIDKGDTLQCSVDSNNTVVDIFKVLDRDPGTSKFVYKDNGTELAVIGPASTNKTITSSSLCGYVHSKNGTLIKTNAFVKDEEIAKYDPKDLNNNGVEDFWEVYNSSKDEYEPKATYYTNVSSAAIVVVDYAEDKIYSGTVDDIFDNETFGAKTSLVVMRWRSNSVREIVVYK